MTLAVRNIVFASQETLHGIADQMVPGERVTLDSRDTKFGGSRLVRRSLRVVNHDSAVAICAATIDRGSLAMMLDGEDVFPKRLRLSRRQLISVFSQLDQLRALYRYYMSLSTWTPTASVRDVVRAFEFVGSEGPDAMRLAAANYVCFRTLDFGLTQGPSALEKVLSLGGSKGVYPLVRLLMTLINDYLSGVDQEKCVEVLQRYYDADLDWTTIVLAVALAITCESNNTAIALMEHPNFSDFTNHALQYLLVIQKLDKRFVDGVVLKVLQHPNFQGLSKELFDFFLRVSARNTERIFDETVIVELLQQPISRTLNQEELSELLISAMNNRSQIVVEALARHPNSHLIPVDVLESLIFDYPRAYRLLAKFPNTREIPFMSRVRALIDTADREDRIGDIFSPVSIHRSGEAQIER